MQEKRQIFSPIKQRILYFIESLHISKRKFYENTMISRGTLDNATGINEETLTKVIANYRNISPTWLITGKGEMLLSNDSTHLTIDVNDTTKKYRTLYKGVPILNEDRDALISTTGVPYYEMLPASAGDFVVFLSKAKPISFINLPQLIDCIAVFPVFGSSMKGIVEPGDLIAIKEIKSRNEFDPALPYLIITDEHRMIKYLHMDEDDNSIIWAESTNLAKIKLQTENIKMVYAIKCVIRFF